MPTEELSVIDQIKQKIDILDPLKFFEHVKILDATTNQIIKYEMWPHLVEFIKAIFEHPQVIVLKSKQVGISWTLAAIALFWCYKMGGNVIMISKGEAEATELLRKSKFIYSQLPKHLQLQVLSEGAEMFSFKNTHSRIHTLPSTEYAGVGETASLVIWDENEFHPNDKENWAHLKPTIDAGAHGIVVSTADPTKIDSHFKTLWREARKGNNNFYPIFIPWNVVPNRTEEWMERIKGDYYLEWQFKANYPETEEEALSPITGRVFFDATRLQKLRQEVLKEEEIRQGAIHIFHYPIVGIQYMAGVDMAEGRGGDFSVLWIEGRRGLERELCAVIHSNQILGDTFAFMSHELLKEYYNPRVICGADPYGVRFLDDLISLGYDRGKIYCSDEKREKLGYKESVKTRDKDLIELDRAIREGLKISYIPAIEELFAFQLKESKSGTRIEAAEGSHDDLVMAACRANFGFKQYKGANQGITVSYPRTWRG
ncbi:MAG: terminase family protein [candidate division WOR-3 bacterium]|nr:terminase family protein [candidate division WOR-3 bacterium]